MRSFHAASKVMFDGSAVVHALKRAGVTHVLWLPDSELGTWDSVLSRDPDLKLIRVCREGEAIVAAAGLLVGGKHPIVMIQCTGLFEAGDALRNVVHDLKLPLFLMIGLRGYRAHRQGATVDTCPLFAEPILRAWQVPYSILDHHDSAADLAAAYVAARNDHRAGAVFLAE
jgi:sulfopyruvate decarboxylase TPP-binding subunit